jgi:hypothetical protein
LPVTTNEVSFIYHISTQIELSLSISSPPDSSALIPGIVSVKCHRRGFAIDVLLVSVVVELLVDGLVEIRGLNGEGCLECLQQAVDHAEALEVFQSYEESFVDLAQKRQR